MSRELFTIEANDLPSKMYTLVLQEPTFEDRRIAMKRMPANPDSNVGYTVEHLLLSMSIYSVNGERVDDHPKDPIYKVRYLPPEDTQFLISVFLEAFTLNDELGDEARRLSEQFQTRPGTVCRIDQDLMPTQKFSVSFRVPTTGDQIDIDRDYPGAGCGYSSEEMLFAHSISHIDDKIVDEKPKDLISFLNDWSHVDAQFAMAVFLNLCFLNKEKQNNAKMLGKGLRKNMQKEDPSKSMSTATRTTRGKASPTIDLES
jgi:hypothetical protein